MKKLTLHIGQPKTGSTSLQHFLFRNKKILQSKGYLYPRAGLAGRQLAHHNFFWLLMKEPKYNPKWGNWQQLHQEISNKKTDHIILSSEGFSRLSIDRNILDKSHKVKCIELLKSQLIDYQVKVVVYLRRQDQMISSRYGHRIKCALASAKPIEQLVDGIKKFCGDYYQFLEPWKEVFGLENIIVRPLEKTQIKDIYNDFMTIIGVEDKSDLIKLRKDRNSRPNQKITEILRFINEITIDRYRLTGLDKQKILKRYHHKIMDSYEKNNLFKEKEMFALISGEDAINIVKEFEESNAKVAQEYLKRNDGILFYEKPKIDQEIESKRFKIDDLTAKDLLEIILTLENLS